MKNIFQAEPFPPATELEVFFNLGQLTFHYITMFIFIILILYSYRNIKDILPVIVIYGFSLLFGMNLIQNGHEPFSPLIEIFFLVFQSTIFLLAAVNMYQKSKTKFNVD